jgi:hypothetical protein
MTVVSMTTVGFGDICPKTIIGRFICSICVTWGVLIVSIMVVVLTNTFSMSNSTHFNYFRLMAITYIA